jgi:hypothetical protein
LNHIYRIHTIPFYISKIHINIVHSPTSGSSEWSLSYWLSHQCPICIPLLTHSCYMIRPSHPSWLIILIIFSEEYTLWSSSLCSFLQLLVTSFHFGPNILLSTLFSDTLSLCSSLNI